MRFHCCRALILVSLLAPSAPAFQWPPIAGSSRYTGSGSNGDTVPSGGSFSGPGDTAPGAGRPSSGGAGAGRGGGKSPGTSPGATGAAAGNGPGAGSNGLAPTNMPTTPSLTMTSDDSWYLWWEYNKAEFLRPNRLELFSAPISGDDALAAMQRFADALRTTLGAAMLDAMQDGDPHLRAAAAIAYGRTNGAAAIPKLCELLADAHIDVRHGAILGLGATGVDSAAELLYSIAKYGSIEGAAHEPVSATAAAHAIVALGIGRRFGFPSTIDTRLAVRVGERTKSERESIGCAAMLYQRLAPCPEFETLAFQMADDEAEPPIVRCRAIEALGGSHSTRALTRLLPILAGSRLDARRSAALALGELADPAALSALCQAYEQESESLTRGFILTAIGRRGGDRARELLLRALQVNPKGMHPWSAIALGILGRRSADPELARSLREALEKESNQQSRGAYWIAIGLVGDPATLPLLAKALADAAEPRSRMYAASALALLGGEEPHRVLRARLSSETSPLVRAALSQALGCLGRSEDLETMSAALETVNDPELQAMCAGALGFHASYDALRRLGAIVLRKEGSSARRAAALEGLGLVLGRHAPLCLMDLARSSNYTLFDDWVNGLYRTTL